MSMMTAVGLQIPDPLRYRQDEHHRDDGPRTESCERERHNVVLLYLDKIRLDLFKSTTSRHIFPKYAVDHVRNRHLRSYFFVYQMNALACIVSFRDHVQFQLGCPDGITFPDHVSKGPVPAEQGITSYQQVTQVNGCGIVGADTHLLEKPGHFVRTIRDQHTEEIIP